MNAMTNRSVALESLNGENILSNIYVGMCREGHYPNAIKVDVPFDGIDGFLFVAVDFGGDDEYGNLIIESSLLNEFNVKVEDAIEAAIRNSKEDAVVKNMADMFSEMFGFEVEKSPLWVVTNSSKVRGAGAILNTDRIREVTGFDKFVAIPSSIHEWLILDESLGCSDDELASMIGGVNSAEVSDNEQLGDKPYHIG